MSKRKYYHLEYKSPTSPTRRSYVGRQAYMTLTDLIEGGAASAGPTAFQEWAALQQSVRNWGWRRRLRIYWQFFKGRGYYKVSPGYTLTEYSLRPGREKRLSKYGKTLINLGYELPGKKKKKLFKRHLNINDLMANTAPGDPINGLMANDLDPLVTVTPETIPHTTFTQQYVVAVPEWQPPVDWQDEPGEGRDA